MLLVGVAINISTSYVPNRSEIRYVRRGNNIQCYTTQSVTQYIIPGHIAHFNQTSKSISRADFLYNNNGTYGLGEGEGEGGKGEGGKGFKMSAHLLALIPWYLLLDNLPYNTHITSPNQPTPNLIHLNLI